MGDEDLPDWAAELEGGGGGSRAGRSGSGREAGSRGGGGGGRDSGGGRKRGRGLALGFLLGAAAGVAGTLFLPDLVAPWLPAGLRGERQIVEGLVLEEKREDGRLLLTVETGEGAVLATFSERVSEIELLVREGDTVALGLDRYRPFVTDPAVEGVRKARRPAAGVSGETREGSDPAAEDAADAVAEDTAGTAAEPSDAAEDDSAGAPAESDSAGPEAGRPRGTP